MIFSYYIFSTSCERNYKKKVNSENQIFKSKKVQPEDKNVGENIHVRRLSKIAGLDHKEPSKGTKARK